MNSWRKVKLNDIAQIEIGKTPPRNEPSYWAASGAESYPWASIADLTSHYVSNTQERITPKAVSQAGVREVPEGTVLMSFKLTIGRIAVAGCNLYTNEAIAAFYPDFEVVDPEFLFYQLPGIAQNAVTDTAVKGATLNKAKIRQLEFELPPLPEQRKIARILSTVDDLIERTEALIAKYRAIKQGLMHDLLTRGVDASGRLRPPRAEAPGLYRESAVGWVPREWEVTTLGAIVREHGGFIQTGPFGSQLHAHEYVAFGVPMVMPQDIEDGFIKEDKIAYITDNKAGELSRHIMTLNDVVFARRGDLSRCAAIGQRETGWLCGTGSMLLRTSPEVIYSRWLSYFYRHDWGQRQILARAVGSTMVNLNSALLQRLIIARPDVKEQKRIIERLDAQDRQIGLQAEYRGKLTLVKAGLMQDLLTGRVRVGA